MSAQLATPLREKAQSIRLAETDRVVITQWTFPPGAESGWHRHEMPYSVVYLTPAFHLVQSSEGEKIVTLDTGAAYSRPAGIEHNVINAGGEEIVLVETELKP